VQDVSKSRLFLVALVAATGLGPLAMQIFLPSLPSIQADLGVSGLAAQLVLSLSMASIAVAMLIYGPLSDRFGRRPMLILGLGLFLIGSFISTLAPSIGVLIVGRIVQAIGGAAPFVLTRTIIRDLYGRERAASMIAYVTTAMVIAPMLAPAIGGYLNDLIGWRANFAFCGVTGILVTALVIMRLPETHHDRVRIPGIVSLFGTFAHLLRMPTFRGFALQSAFCFASFFSFAAAAPYVVIVVMERSASVYGLFFIVISFAFMFGNFVAGRISERVGIDRMVLIGSSLAVFGTLSGLICLLLFGWVPWALFGPTSGFSADADRRWVRATGRNVAERNTLSDDRVHDRCVGSRPCDLHRFVAQRTPVLDRHGRRIAPRGAIHTQPGAASHTTRAMSLRPPWVQTCAGPFAGRVRELENPRAMVRHAL
jgi:DHA1 family bicyclomycin/chloramphenicol resistance-like MFS transporter